MIDIDWDEAPEGTTHYGVEYRRWYKLEGGLVSTWVDDGSYWIKSFCNRSDISGSAFIARNLPDDELDGDEQGRKDDSAKELMHLIPAKAEMALARVLTFGAKKYAPENWRKVDNPIDRYMAAAMRHMNAHRQGELRDEESGELHLSHALTCLSFLVELLEADNE